MAIEIERKFLLRNESWRERADQGTRYCQGYLDTSAERSIRVRIGGDRAWLCIKSATSSIRRHEYEYEIPVQDARELLSGLFAGLCVEKTRYRVPHGDHVWEIDVFEGANAGLVVAEVELGDEQEDFKLPAWAGDEVSDDPRYHNMNLAKLPYTQW